MLAAEQACRPQPFKGKAHGYIASTEAEQVVGKAPQLFRFASLKVQTMQQQLTEREGLIAIQQRRHQTINQWELHQGVGQHRRTQHRSINNEITRELIRLGSLSTPTPPRRPAKDDRAQNEHEPERMAIDIREDQHQPDERECSKSPLRTFHTL